jgi:radical SAM protein with 4Fe4S-binding SPASM domain
MKTVLKRIKQGAEALFGRRVSFTHDGFDYKVEGVSTGKPYNWVMGEFTGRIKPLRPRVMPKYLEVEPTNFCNLSCPGCGAGRGDTRRERGKMTFELFCKAVDELRDYLLLVILYERGEPFLNEDLPLMIKYAVRNGLKVCVSTNGHFLDSRETVAAVVDSGLDHLIVSLDGATPDTYGEYRRGGDFQKVLAGIRTLVGTRNSKGLERPRINLRFIPMRHNETEIPHVLKIASLTGVDSFSIKTYNPSQGAADEFLPRNELYRRFSYDADGLAVRNRRNLCTKLWNTMTVRWNGTVVPCNCDNRDGFVLGDLNEQTLPEIWTGEAYARFRKGFRNDWKAHPICGGCTYAYMKQGSFTCDVRYAPDFNHRERVTWL